MDDTLYDVSTGFTTHRNTDGATSFMVQRLGFPDAESAQRLRDEYFERYHSTVKGLTAAEEDGRLPPLKGEEEKEEEEEKKRGGEEEE